MKKPRLATKRGQGIAALFFSACTLFAPIAGAAERTTIAVLDLEPHEGVETGYAGGVSDRVRHALKKAGKFKLTSRRAMEAILKEQDFQYSGRCDDMACVVEIGNIIGVQKMVAGSIAKMGGLYQVTLQLIDVQSAEIENDVLDTCRCDEEGLLQMAEEEAYLLAGVDRGKGPRGRVDPPPSRPAGQIVVSKDGRGEFTTIGAAIARVKEGTRILVRPAVYREGLVIDRNVEIVGDGSRREVIIESIGSNCILMQTESALVRGMTLRCVAGPGGKEYFAVDIPRGKPVIENCDIESDSLAAVAIHGSGAQPVIRDCRIRDGRQGGVFVYGNGRGTLEGCEIYGNTYAGVEIKEGGDPVVRHCRIRDGKQGGVMVGKKGKGTVEECEIYGNGKPGVEIKRGGDPVIRSCRIRDGKQGGLFVWENGKGTVKECEIYGNAYAGVEIKEGGDPAIRNCTIRNGKSGGVLVGEKGKGTVEGCEIYGNAFAGVEIKRGGDPAIRNCKIRDGKQGGVFVNEKGRGTFEGCEIYGNTYAGVEIKREGDPVIRNSKINWNDIGVYAHENGRGTVTGCDLTGNRRGPWDIQEGSRIRRRGNKD